MDWGVLSTAWLSKQSQGWEGLEIVEKRMICDLDNKPYGLWWLSVKRVVEEDR